jgi:hypothetical protein
MVVDVIRAEPAPPPIKQVMLGMDPAGAYGLLCYLRNVVKHYSDNGQSGSPVWRGRLEAQLLIELLEPYEEELRQEL